MPSFKITTCYSVQDDPNETRTGFYDRLGNKMSDYMMKIL